jgi:hypothetical protein
VVVMVVFMKIMESVAVAIAIKVAVVKKHVI